MSRSSKNSRGKGNARDRRKTGPTPPRQSHRRRASSPVPDANRAALEITQGILRIANRTEPAPIPTFPGELHITIATGTGQAMTVEVEERLVRSALLYADRITLLSPGAYLLESANALRSATERDLVELLRRAGPYLPGFDTAILNRPPELLAQLLAGGPGDEIRQQLIEATDDITGTPSMRALGTARDLGLLSIEGLAKRPEDEANLESMRQHSASSSWSDGEGVGGAAEVMMARLMTLMERGHSLPLLDDQIGELVRLGIAEGLFVPGRTARERAAHAGAATGFIERLPTFPHASMDEIIDIRRELEQPLLRFRREVMRLSAAMADHALAVDFADDIDREWHGTVHPALAEIEEVMSSNAYLSVLAGKTTQPKRVMEAVGGATSGGILGVIMGSTTPLAFALAAAAAGLGAALDAYSDTRNTAAAQAKSRFWFLYEANQRMS